MQPYDMDRFDTKLEQATEDVTEINQLLDQMASQLLHQIGIACLTPNAGHLQQLIMMRELAKAQLHLTALWNCLTEIERRMCQLQDGALSRPQPFN